MRGSAQLGGEAETNLATPGFFSNGTIPVRMSPFTMQTPRVFCVAGAESPPLESQATKIPWKQEL